MKQQVHLFSARKKFPATGSFRSKLFTIFEMSPRALENIELMLSCFELAQRTSHQKSRRIYLLIWPKSWKCFENYQCQSCETESIYSSGGNQQEGPAPWRVHADTVMLLPNQENIAVRARPAHQLVIVSQNGNKHALCWTHPLGGEGPAYSVTSSPLKSSPESNVLPDVQNEECLFVVFHYHRRCFYCLSL